MIGPTFQKAKDPDRRGPPTRPPLLRRIVRWFRRLGR